MVEFEFITKNTLKTHSHSTIEVLFVIAGDFKIYVDDDAFLLHQDDFIVVNTDKSHSYEGSGDILAGSLQLSRMELKKLLKQNSVFFFCNSTLGTGDKYDELRSSLKKICNYHLSGQGKSEIYLISLYYDFLNTLTGHFLLTQVDERYSEIVHKDEERKQGIEDYINENYAHEISLNDLSEKMYLSEAYLSKYIKKQFGMRFLEYVNKIRIEHAIVELLNSDKPVVRIAMDTGFSSSASFNKAFKEKYGITPSVYRVQWKGNPKEQLKAKNNLNELDNQLIKYYQQHVKEEADDNSVKHKIVVDLVEASGEMKHRCKLMNIGTADSLIHSDMQEHILRLKTELGIKYIRFWDLYSPEMFLDEHTIDKKYNFGKLNRVLDFLVVNGLIPYIELGVKPKRLIKKHNVLLLQEKSQKIFKNVETLKYFIQCFIKHLINRYGAEELSRWYFEYWRVEIEGERGKDERLSDLEEYLNNFDAVASTMKNYLPSVRLGGNGLSFRYGKKNFIETIEGWCRHEHRPDFISLYCYPYIFEEDDEYNMGRMSLDNEYVKKYICTAKRLIEEVGLPINEIHVSEWNFTVSNRNILNDSCMKGAYLVKNILDTNDIDKVSILGYWIGSDLFADFYDAGEFLNGGSGLVTKEGIAKPSYYAFKFLKKLEGNRVQKGNNYMITETGRDNYRIVCHNFKKFNYQYYLIEEDEVNIDKLDDLLDDDKKECLQFKIKVSRNGKFKVKISSVNKEHGSIQDEWLRMGKPEEMLQEDIDYLSRICVPRISMCYIETDNNTIRFETSLEPNEIQFIEAIYLY